LLFQKTATAGSDGGKNRSWAIPSKGRRPVSAARWNKAGAARKEKSAPRGEASIYEARADGINAYGGGPSGRKVVFPPEAPHRAHGDFRPGKREHVARGDSTCAGLSDIAQVFGFRTDQEKEKIPWKDRFRKKLPWEKKRFYLIFP